MQLSDPTGLYEVTVFSDTLEAARDLLEPGQNVVLTVEATLEGETLKLLARGVQPIDSVAADAGATSVRVHIDRAEAASAIASLLARISKDAARNRGAVVICVPDSATGQEIDLELPGDYPVSPQVKGAIKSMSGVVMVEDL